MRFEKWESCASCDIVFDAESDDEQTVVDACAWFRSEHRGCPKPDTRVSMLACKHNVPNFGPPCPVCDVEKK